MSEDEILKMCETAISALEAINNGRLKQAEGPVRDYYQIELDYLQKLRARVNYWRKTGRLLDSEHESEGQRYARMLVEMTSLSDWQQAGYSIADYEAHMARFGKEAGE